MVDVGILFQFEQFGLETGGQIQSLILFLQLINVLNFEIGIGQEPHSHGLETGKRGREKDAGQVDDVTRGDETGEGSVEVTGHAAGDVSHRDLVRLYALFISNGKERDKWKC